MDEFVKRPAQPRINLNDPKKPVTGKSIVVKDTSDAQQINPSFQKLAVRPQLSRASVPPPSRPIIELPDTRKPAPDADTQSMLKPEALAKAGAAAEVGAKTGVTKRFRFKFKPRMPRNKKEWIIAGAALFVLLAGIGAVVYFVFLKPDPPKPVAKAPAIVKPAPKPEPILSLLTGLPIEDKSLNAKQVTAVQIENSPDARPQSGLKDAGIVFEAIAEGGITRFNVLYQDTTPDYIGPIRSIRPYYIDWFLPFDAALAHVGGSPQGLSDLKTLGAKDLDQFANGGYYTRIADRFAPHNVYTSVAKLNELESSKGFNTSTYEPFTRKKEAKLATPTAKSINLAISSFLYNVHYDYDATTNSYLRSEGGEPHKDERSGAQLSPKVVVAIAMGRGIDGDGQHTAYTTTGSGDMFVFQDGGVVQGTWSKNSRESQWKFTGKDGKPIAFNPGQTWFTMVDNAGAATYAP